MCPSKDRTHVLYGLPVPILRCGRLVPRDKNMKNILGSSNFGFTKWCVALIAAGWIGAAQAQSLYESFNYTVPGNVGGTADTADATGNNNWATHSTSNANPISLVSGSLSYPGLATSVGNRINMPGNSSLVPRDINRATGITGTPSVAYFSFLLNVINKTQLSTQNDYFVSFGNTSGAVNTTFFGRVSIKSVNTAANFRLGISNTTGGTPTYTDVPTDLVFGQTYLVVVKYDFNSTANDIATIWVNPTLGATEPTGGTSNNSGNAAAATTFASIALRNAGSTPNADIDEIRVGTTWASVTPAGASSSPSVNPSVSTLSGFTTTAGTASTAQTFSVTGSNLTADVTVTAPAGFEVSKDGTNYASSQILTQSAGVVASTTISVRIAASAVAGPLASANVTLASGSTTANVAVSGTVNAAGAAAVSVTGGTLTAFSTVAGTASAAQSFTVSGSNLNSDITVTAPTGFEVSTDATSYASSKTVTQVSGTAAATTISVRIAASTAAGPLASANVTVAATDVTTANVAVSGTVTQPALTLVLTPTTVAENAGASASTGTVGIPASLSSDLIVNLASANTAAATVPASVTIPSGQISATFAIDALANTNSYVNETAEITASNASYASAIATLTVQNVDVRVPTVVVNKFENTSVDVIELLVVGNGTPGSSVDMRGMLIKDHSSDNANDNGGKYVFSSNSLWQAVPAGTLVVLTLDDTATDANVDGYVVRVGLSNLTYFVKGTGTMNLANTDMVMIKQAGSLEAGSVGMIHALANGSPAATQTAGAGSPKLVSNVGNAGVIYASNPNSTIADYNGSSVALGAAGTIPFGSANNPANAAFIANLRGTKDISISIDANAVIINEDAGVQADKITVALSVAATTDLTVNLSATPAGIVNLPESVTIPAGSSSVTVGFTPINDNTTAGNRRVTIAGSADTWSPANNTVTVVDVQFTNPSVVINEVVNNGSAADSVELLAIQNNLSMVGMILKDFSTNMSVDAGAQYTFVDTALWQSVKAGTLIVLTMDATATEDTDASDGLVTVKLTNTSYFTLSGGSFDISNTDLVMIKAAGSGASGIVGAIHTFGSGTAGSLFKLANGAKLLFAAGGAGGGADNATSAISDYNGIGATAGNTLGTYNNASNQTYITALRGSANSAPTAITLSSDSFPENNPPNLVVGTLTTTDDNAAGATYAFTTGAGDTDNGAFNILGNSLRATAPLDFEAKPSSTYSVLIQVTDAGGLTFTQQFTITVTDVNETPADTTPPVITLIGDNPQLIANGAVYADLGASVTDNVDATRTIQGTGTVNTAAAGDYTITYNATDAANNAATQVTRTVRVAGTYADWSGGSTLDSAGLAKYAIGGASSLTANDGVKPTTTLTGEFLVITAIVRTDNSRLAVVAQAVTDLANYASGTGVTTVNGVETTDQEGVPTGHKRKTFSIARNGDARKFMRLSASLALSGTNTTVSVARDSGGATFLQVTGATAGTTGGGSATSEKRTVYYFAPDTTSSPTFSGTAWPYVIVQGQLSAGAGVTATLTKNSSGMLLVNGLPAYQFGGDSSSTTANGVGGTWPGMKADGTKTTTAPGGTIQ